MTLATGTRLGAYEITADLGAGGMGQVYRARDTRLHRDVALKVLPGLFAADPERLARFEREARTLASLNHPHIAQIYGVEGEGAARALVMELVDGEDLAVRLARGKLPVEDAIPIARQIAAALDAAHAAGIVHRDLKPANIKVRPDGTVKVLDFGLAKAFAGDPASVSSDALANSPTLTSPATEAGFLLGTAAYMAPEQAKGRPVDSRVDLWAFGCVLFEMLTGRRAFAGESMAEVLANVLKATPDWSALPSDTPPALQRLLRRTLEKDPKRRLRSAADAALELDDAPDLKFGPTVDAATRARGGRRMAALAAAGWIAALAAAAALVVTIGGRTTPEATLLRLELPLGTAFEPGPQNVTANFAIAPDGTRLVFPGRQGDGTALYLQDLRTGDIRALPDTAGAMAPFFSPDGESIGFASRNTLRVLSLTASIARDIATAPAIEHLEATWTTAGTILFTEAGGLARVAAEGGNVELVAPLAKTEGFFAAPHALPGGEAVLVAMRDAKSTHTDDPSQIAAIDLKTGGHRTLVQQGATPRFVPLAPSASDGFIVYGNAGRLWAVRFDARRLATSGTPRPVLDNVDVRANGDGAQFSVASNGTLVYHDARQHELVWVDRAGQARPATSTQRRFAMPRLSPDGRRIAVEVQDTPHQDWLVDPERDLLTPITSTPGGSHAFAWSPDGRGIAHSAGDGARTRIMWTAADGTGAAAMLYEPTAGASAFAEGWSHDGRWIAATVASGSDYSVVLLPMAGGTPPRVSGEPRTIVRVSSQTAGVSFSPDDRWLAYGDNLADSRSSRISIVRLSDGARYQVSGDGSTEPVWSASGRELYFRRGRSVMVVDLALAGETGARGAARPVSPASDGPGIGRPRVLFEGDFLIWGNPDYDVASDGRFLMVRPADSEASRRRLQIRVNWVEELRKLK